MPASELAWAALYGIAHAPARRQACLLSQQAGRHPHVVKDMQILFEASAHICSGCLDGQRRAKRLSSHMDYIQYLRWGWNEAVEAPCRSTNQSKVVNAQTPHFHKGRTTIPSPLPVGRRPTRTPPISPPLSLTSPGHLQYNL